MEDINTLTQKANSGDAVAMRKLGYEYLIGKNIQKDEKKAFQLFRAAVWEGDLNATIYCGYCCKTGAGLEKPNIVAAARYYEYGARAGVAAAQPWYNVGLDQDSWTFRQRNQKLILNSEVRSWNHLLQKDDNPATAFLKGSGCKTDQQKDNKVP